MTEKLFIREDLIPAARNLNRKIGLYFKLLPTPRRCRTPFLVLLIIFIPLQSALYGQPSWDVAIEYSDPAVLKEFNQNLQLVPSLSRFIKRKDVITAEDEVYAKVNLIVEKVEAVLDMYPDNIKFKLWIFPDKKKVADHYKKTYGQKADYIAYYSLSRKTIYISADDATLKVLAHEIGHMVVDHFFQVRPPYSIHELLAQYAEKHVSD